MKNLKKTDLVLYQLIQKEAKRQSEGLEMIPSENYVSPSVLEAMGSILTNKYSEGYPRKRYYGGNEVIDEVELLAIERAKKVFGVKHANVQPYSGSPANLAVYLACCNPGDTIMGQALTAGGHLTHGWKVSATGMFYHSVQYGVRNMQQVAGSRPQGEDLFDYDEIMELAKQHKPKLIWVGATAYPLEFDYAKFAKIADSVGAYLAADIAHVAGLIIAGAHRSPVPYVHIVTTTSHKTLRGPRGALIMVTKKGIAKDPELPDKIDRAIFPGLQGGPHDHITGAIAAALKEASTPSFKRYGKQIVANAKALAKDLISNGFTLVAGRTENHLILIDLIPTFGPGGGVFMQLALDQIGISLNKNTIPGEPSSPFYPSGVRLGTPCVTTRGMKEKEMKVIAKWYKQVANEISSERLPKTKEERIEYLKNFRKQIAANKRLKTLREEVRKFALKFPVPGIG